MAAGTAFTSIDHNSQIQSGTQSIQSVTVPHPRDFTRRVVFVDTPGFSDTAADISKIFGLIINWLKNS